MLVTDHPPPDSPPPAFYLKALAKDLPLDTTVDKVIVTKIFVVFLFKFHTQQV